MSVKVTAKVEKSINYVRASLGTKVLSMDIESTSSGEFIVQVTTFPEVFKQYVNQIILTANVKLTLEPELIVDPVYFRENMAEAKNGSITVEIFDPQDSRVPLGAATESIKIQPYTHWDKENDPVSLVCFMQPNHSCITPIMKKAAEFCNAEAHMEMIGYQLGGGENVRHQVKCIYEALQDANIHYMNPPASFELIGQKVRTPSVCLANGGNVGTCLDLAALFCSCLEANNLNSFIVFIPGHAFAGVWLKEKSFSQPMVTSLTGIPDAVVNGELLLIECTLFTDPANGRYTFEQACKSGGDKISRISFIIDVVSARRRGYTPAFAYDDSPLCGNDADTRIEELTEAGKNKYQLMKRQALQTWGSSNLITLGRKDGSTEFEIEARAVFETDISSEELDNAVKVSFLRGSGRDEEYNRYLKELQMAARDEIKEKGRSNLCIALNRLHWKSEKSKKDYSSPLLFYPVVIEKDMRGEYHLRFGNGDVYNNVVVSELLYEEYGMDIRQALRRSRYQDLMDTLNYIIEKKKDWTVEENIASVGIFAIPNEAVYRTVTNPAILDNPLVRSLLNGKMADMAEEPEEDSGISDNNEVFALQSDSSQNIIIKGARRLPAQIGSSPAGNGKTQTIVNIACDYIKSGKKVLFLSEKLASHIVVSRMMKDLGLDAFTLRIIEGKTTVTDVITKLRDTSSFLEHREIAAIRDGGELEDYSEAESKLLEFYHAMSSVLPECNMTPAELFEMHERYKDTPITLAYDKIENMPRLSHGERLIRKYAKASKENRRSSAYKKYLKSTAISMEERDIARNKVNKALNDLANLKYYADDLQRELKIEFLHTPEKKRIADLCSYASVLSECREYGVDIQSLISSVRNDNESLAREMTQRINELNRLSPGTRSYIVARRYFLEDYKSLLGTEDEQMINEDRFDEFTDKIESGAFRKACDPGTAAILNAVENIESKIRSKAASKTHEEALVRISHLIAAGEGQSKGQSKGQDVMAKARSVVSAFQTFVKSQQMACDLVVEDAASFRKEHPLDMIDVLFREWQKNDDNSRAARYYQKAVEEAVAEGIGYVIDQLENRADSKTIDENCMLDAFRYCWCEYYIRKARAQYPLLEESVYMDFPEILHTFIETEKSLRRKYVEQLQTDVITRILDEKKNALVCEEVGKLEGYAYSGRRPNITIRNIFETVPHAITERYPFIMMTPGAVSEHIPTGFPDFDMVLIDEGSQTPAYRVLYPISHARKICIFGDDHQLMPSQFFQKNYEEDGEMLPAESIMESAVKANMPKRILKFHYRSESEQLIEFSNSRYYNNDIVTFPSPYMNEKSIDYIFVDNSQYDRGGKKVNVPEAEKVVKTVRDIVQSYKNETKDTIGVIAANYSQMMLIRKCLLKEAVNDSALGSWIDDRISVVNLESCQGREWDHVVLSVTYGPDRNGRLPGGIGVFSFDGGENRVNVMTSRARKKMYVVTSLEPEMLVDATAKGVKDLRDFLAFARGDFKEGRRNADEDVRGEGILASVASRFEKLGFKVHTNIGSSRCKIDIAVVSKKNPGQYALGVILDRFDASLYHVKDSEIIMPEVLKSKGWKVFRLHSVNWYDDSDYEMKEMIRVIQEEG